MGKGKNKGTNFERQICKQLSLWWSKGVDDDIFWRTPGSGAKATVRNKKNKKSMGFSDIQATNPIGQPLIDLCTIELKRGYSKSTFADLVEPSTHVNPKPCQYEKFIIQALDDCKSSGSKTWLLIIKRDRKETIVLMSFHLYKLFGKQKTDIWKAPCFYLNFRIGESKKGIKVFGCLLDNFLKKVNPKHIKKMIKIF